MNMWRHATMVPHNRDAGVSSEDVAPSTPLLMRRRTLRQFLTACAELGSPQASARYLAIRSISRISAANAASYRSPGTASDRSPRLFFEMYSSNVWPMRAFSMACCSS